MARTDLPKLYNWTDNRPDPNSQDYREVMAWLSAHGAPAPQFATIAIDAAGWPYPEQGPIPPSIPVLIFPGDLVPHDAALVLNSPGVVLVELGLEPNVLNYAAPTAPIEPAKPISYHVGQPLGRGWYAQLEPETDPVKDGEIVTGPDGRRYQFVKGMIGGWYKEIE